MKKKLSKRDLQALNKMRKDLQSMWSRLDSMSFFMTYSYCTADEAVEGLVLADDVLEQLIKQFG